jgi:hypothetical protein
MLVLCGRILWTPLFVSLYHTDSIADTFLGVFNLFVNFFEVWALPMSFDLFYESHCTTFYLMCDACVLND